ncbi:hypothetical protein Verru16b_00696 [Lacunisphaera limnophila]|uniref:Protease PrsW n=1 Tax=Lacunisphaera limnophila TaxID=1838286 RepID=A0A1D8ARX2_9BACT|nr:PrsW family glutamic-type intramembrane protease [Lacunisphaera limnophila]AOS43644.1 hypothetical protein Verru16b_00696 [Lacunisphaera limnophila]
MNAPQPHPAPLPLFQPRRAAFWLFLLLVVAGLSTVGQTLLSGLRVMPVSALAGAAAWALYTLPLLWIFRRLGVFRGQTAAPFVLAFAWGGLGAVFLALPANQAMFGILSKLVSPEFCHTWGPAIAGPTDEEPLKLIGVILLLLIAPGRFRTISSVMALGFVVGLGFQVVEDYFYTVSTALNHPNAHQLEPVVQILVLRGGFCGPWSHAAYTAIASFGVGYFVARRDLPTGRRLGVAALALLTAWALHGFWNSPALGSLMEGLTILLYFPLKGLPVLLAALLLWRVARHEKTAV